MPIKTKPVAVVEETQNQDVQTADQVVDVEETEATAPKRRGAPKGVSRGPGYPWTQEHYNLMKSHAQAQAKAGGGVVNLAELHRTLIALPEFKAVPMELKELTLRNFYNARQNDLKKRELPEGVTERTPEMIYAILPKVGGTRTKISLV